MLYAACRPAGPPRVYICICMQGREGRGGEGRSGEGGGKAGNADLLALPNAEQWCWCCGTPLYEPACKSCVQIRIQKLSLKLWTGRRL